MKKPLVGVLGGMGPLATVDFLGKLIEETPAEIDQEHVPVVVWSVPQLPDRQKALDEAGESPLPALIEGIDRLTDAGATRIVVACNTAHAWYDALSARSPVPILHIVDAVVACLKIEVTAPARVGVLATRGTLASGIYQTRLAREGFDGLFNTDEELDALFKPGCYSVKRGEIDAGGRLFERAAAALIDRGATRLILACTEIPIALERIRSRHLPVCIDSNRALAKACVDYWRGATMHSAEKTS
ncbi:MAG: amino acid racemase [Candidatus Accumulibacter sp.]|jgi:aspartate racemase|nr:amino acid racemase [Accumulibacter sp.]